MIEATGAINSYRMEGYKMSLLSVRAAFKPFGYPWAYDAWLMQQKISWLPEEVVMTDDVSDWNTNLSNEEKNLVTQILRFFVQGDVAVSNAYLDLYITVFKLPDLRMMFTGFANAEMNHQIAYSQLIDTLGLPETEYSSFLEYEEMQIKQNFFVEFTNFTLPDLARSIAAFGAFTEGLSLFASFAILMNFQRFNKLKGVGQIVAWSVRDESLHVESMIKLFNTLIVENPDLWSEKLKSSILEICQQVVANEDKFIDLAFALGPVQGLSAADVKKYIRYLADRRLTQLNLRKIFYINKNPLPFMDDVLNATEFANFFETKATEYSRAATTGNWGDVFDLMGISNSEGKENGK